MKIPPFISDLYRVSRAAAFKKYENILPPNEPDRARLQTLRNFCNNIFRNFYASSEVERLTDSNPSFPQLINQINAQQHPFEIDQFSSAGTLDALLNNKNYVKSDLLDQMIMRLFTLGEYLSEKQDHLFKKDVANLQELGFKNVFIILMRAYQLALVRKNRPAPKGDQWNHALNIFSTQLQKLIDNNPISYQKLNLARIASYHINKKELPRKAKLKFKLEFSYLSLLTTAAKITIPAFVLCAAAHRSGLIKVSLEAYAKIQSASLTAAPIKCLNLSLKETLCQNISGTKPFDTLKKENIFSASAFAEACLKPVKNKNLCSTKIHVFSHLFNEKPQLADHYFQQAMHLDGSLTTLSKENQALALMSVQKNKHYLTQILRILEPSENARIKFLGEYFVQSMNDVPIEEIMTEEIESILFKNNSKKNVLFDPVFAILQKNDYEKAGAFLSRMAASQYNTLSSFKKFVEIIYLNENVFRVYDLEKVFEAIYNNLSKRDPTAILPFIETFIRIRIPDHSIKNDSRKWVTDAIYRWLSKNAPQYLEPFLTKYSHLLKATFDELYAEKPEYALAYATHWIGEEKKPTPDYLLTKYRQLSHHPELANRLAEACSQSKDRDCEEVIKADRGVLEIWAPTALSICVVSLPLFAIFKGVQANFIDTF